MNNFLHTNIKHLYRCLIALANIMFLPIMAMGQIVEINTGVNQIQVNLLDQGYEPKNITHLKVTGIIDARDFRYIRNNISNLEELDLSGITKIESYAGYEGTYTYPGLTSGMGSDRDGYHSYPLFELPTQAFSTWENGRVIGWDNPLPKLKKVILPSCIKTIGDYAFYVSHGIETIVIGEDNLYFKTIDGVLYTKDGKILLQYPLGRKGDFTLPASVTKIESLGTENASFTNLTLQTATPPELTASSFNATTVWVPKGSLATYQAHGYWRKYNLKEIGGVDPALTVTKGAVDHFAGGYVLQGEVMQGWMTFVKSVENAGLYIRLQLKDKNWASAISMEYADEYQGERGTCSFDENGVAWIPLMGRKAEKCLWLISNQVGAMEYKIDIYDDQKLQSLYSEDCVFHFITKIVAESSGDIEGEIGDILSFSLNLSNVGIFEGESCDLTIFADRLPVESTTICYLENGQSKQIPMVANNGSETETSGKITLALEEKDYVFTISSTIETQGWLSFSLNNENDLSHYITGPKSINANISNTSNPNLPSDATLKSLSYQIGNDGAITPVPNFSPDVYRYEIGYKSNEDAIAAGQAPLYPDGTCVYPSGVATNEKAQVLPSDMLLPYGFAKVGVASEDKSTERTYSLFMMSEKDAGKKYYVMMNLEHMTVQINGTTYKNGDIYKADHNENVTVKLIPDQGYKLPSSIQIDEGSSISFLELGQTSEINLREINWHMSLSASAVENTGQEDNSIFVYDNLKYRITGNNTVSVVGPDTQDNATWPITSCSIPATIIHDGKTYNVTIIEEDAFNGCTKLAGITLPEGIKSIRANAFNMCQALTSIIIPASVDSIGDYAFDNDENLAKVTLKEGLKVIGQGTFEDCAITSLEIPSTVVEMDEGDLFDTMLATINVHTNNTVYASIDGILYNKAKTSLLFCPPMYPVKKCTIPDKVTSIRNEAFQNCEKIEEIILPEGIETIGTDAFCSCIALKSITIPSTIKTLGGYLFEGDGDYAVHLDEIHCNHQNPADITIDTSADTFYGIDFNTCKLYVPKGTKTKYQTAEGWKRFKNIIEEGDNLPLIPDKIDDEITLNTDSTYTDGEGNTGHFNGMIGNGEEETAINKLTIKGSATSTTTTITFNHVTVGNGSSTSETTTSVTKNTNVVIELIGDNSLGKLVNDGIAKLISKVEAALKNTVVINNGIFVDETGLLTRVEGAAELDITAPSDQEVRPGENVTLTASTKVSVTYAVTFIWEQLQPDGTWKAVGSPNVYTPARSGLRSTATVTDRLTIQAKDAGKYRCVIRNKVGDVSSTLTTPPATVMAKSTVDIVTPKSYRKVTPCGNQLHFEISTPTEVKIINLNGAIIRSVSLPAGDTYIDGLDKGVYILLFEDGVTQKVRI